MNYKAAFLLALSLTVAGAANSFAQSRTLGAQSIVLDDGAGHTVTLVVAGPAGGTFTFPAGGGTIATQASLSGFLPLTGGTMTGGVNMGGHAISNASTVTVTANGNTTPVNGTVYQDNLPVAWGTVNVSTGALTSAYGVNNTVVPFLGGVQLNLGVYQNGGTVIATPASSGSTVTSATFFGSICSGCAAAVSIVGSGTVNYVVYARP